MIKIPGVRLLSQKQWDDLVMPHSAKIMEDLNGVFGDLNLMFNKLQMQNKKKELSLATISFLRTGIITSSALFRVDLLDSRRWKDPEECCLFWQAEYLKDLIEKNIAKPLLYFEEKNDIPLYKYTKHRLGEFIKLVRSVEKVITRNISLMHIEDVPIVDLWFGELLDKGHAIGKIEEE